MSDPGLILLVSLVLASTVFLVTLINTDAAIIFLIVSMLLSPELSLGAVQPDRAVVIRFDDLLLGVVFVSWLAKLTINKELGLIRSTPLNLPIGLFLVSCVVSTGWGVLNGEVTKPLAAVFYLLKYFEYCFLFFMIANVIRDRRQVRLFLIWLLVVAVIVSGFGYWQIFRYGPGFRITAPFEGSHAEPNTLAGYLLIMMALCLGLLLYRRSRVQQLALLALIGLMLVPFMYTYSRGGYLAFVVMYLTICVFSQRYRPLLWGLLVLGVFLIPTVIPSTVSERIAETFDPRSSVQFGGMRLSRSPAYRLLVWKLVIEKWFQHPFLGSGVTGLGFLVDNQHALVLGEVGLLGVLVYIWVRWRLLTISFRHFKTMTDPLAQGLCLGFVAGLAGLLVQSFAGEVFIIVRIMEPFWFLAAIGVVLPRLVAPASAPSVPVPRLLRA